MPRARVTISVLILHQVTRDKTAHTREGGGGGAAGKGEDYNEEMKSTKMKKI